MNFSLLRMLLINRIPEFHWFFYQTQKVSSSRSCVFLARARSAREVTRPFLISVCCIGDTRGDYSEDVRAEVISYDNMIIYLKLIRLQPARYASTWLAIVLKLFNKLAEHKDKSISASNLAEGTGADVSLIGEYRLRKR